MLTAFQLDDQVFRLKEVVKKPTANGRWVRVGVWYTRCPDCRMPFTQEHQNAGFIPAHSTTRRCLRCRKSDGDRIKPLIKPPHYTSDEPMSVNTSPRLPDKSARLEHDVHAADFPREVSTPSSTPPSPVAKVRLFTDR